MVFSAIDRRFVRLKLLEDVKEEFIVQAVGNVVRGWVCRVRNVVELGDTTTWV